MDSRPEMAGRDECTPRVVPISLAGGAPVMATGIVSTALDLDGRRVAAGALLALACGVMAGVLGLLAIRAAVRPAGLAEEASRPASLTVVAALCVLGTRLTRPGTRAVGAALL